MNRDEPSFLAQHSVLLSFMVSIAAILTVGLIGTIPLWARWLAILFVMVLFLAVVGYDKSTRSVVVNGKSVTVARWDGVLIDDRNKISLSRFQIILWTLIALSAWAALVLHRTIPVARHTIITLTLPLTDSLQSVLSANQVTLETPQIEALYLLLTQDKTVPAAGPLDNFEPLNVSFPNELLLAMGISTTSLALSAVIKNNKANKEDGTTLERQGADIQAAKTALTNAQTDQAALDMALVRATREKEANTDATLNTALEARLKTAQADVKQGQAMVDAAQKKYTQLQTTEQERLGLLQANANVQDARWSDMLSGERVQDFQYVDISKVQMFFFTVIIVFSYAALIGAQFTSPGAQTLLGVLPKVSLPGFSESLVALLGLSHAGYLTVKTASQ